MSLPLQFQLQATDGAARRGVVTTRHGSFDTPAFMPVGTQGSVKGILPEQIAATKSQIILGNTYHLMLRPGEKVVADLGGIQRFMGWDNPVLTDSGGYQVFSLADIRKINDAGVVFKSHIDGSLVNLTPTRSIQVQNDLGADIIMAFDECPKPDAPIEYQQEVVDRTIRWAAECKQAHARPGDQSLFGIVQGGINRDLRLHCRDELIKLDFPGYAIGGLAVGEGFDAMRQVIGWVAPGLPEAKPRYLMGVGFPRDIVAAVALGIDMFDCVMPTRNGRNAYAFTAGGALRLRNSGLARDTGPIEADCDCYTCRTFTRGALRHFFLAGEMLGPILVSLHNVRFYQRLMEDIRRAIAAGTFAQFARNDPRCSLGPSEDSTPERTSDTRDPDAG